MAVPAQSDVINVLMVDDQDPPMRELKLALAEAENTCEFSFLLKCVVDPQDYQRAVRERTGNFDVLVCDLKLTVEQQRLSDWIAPIVAWHQVISPDTIIIVYSVFTSSGGDELATAVDTCVEAMRAGAASCIRKARGSTAKLVDTIITELRRRRDPSLVFDAKWWSDHVDELVRDYHGKAIAVLGDKVISYAETIPELRTRLREIGLTVHKGMLPRLMLVPDIDDEE